MRGRFYCGDVGGLLTGPEDGLEPKGVVGEPGLLEPGPLLNGDPGVLPLLPEPFRLPDEAGPPPKRLTELNMSSTGS